MFESVRLLSKERHLDASSSSTIMTRVSKGVGALAFGTAIRGVGHLLIVPIALRAWGELQYGEWVLLTGLVSFLTMADLGLQSFVVNRLCATHVQDNRQEMHRIFHNALRVQYAVIFGLLLLIGIILYSVPLDQLLGLRTISRPHLFPVVLLLSLEVLISIPLALVAGLYRATGHLARGAMIWTVQQALTIALTLALIAGHASFLSIAGARACITILQAAWIIHDLRGFYPWLRIWPTTGTPREGMEMIGPGLFFLLITMADSFSSQFMLFVIQGQLLDASEVTRFATHRILIGTTQVFSLLLMYSVWPELSRLHARSDDERLRRIHKSLAKLNLWLVGGITFGLLPLMPRLYSIWTDGKLVLEEWTVGFLIARTLIWAAWGPSLTLLLATNRHGHLVPVLLGSFMLTGLLAIALVPTIGIAGAALAVLLGEVCSTAWLVPALASRCIGDRVTDVLGETAKALICGIGLPVLLGLVIWHWVPYPGLRYAIIIPLCGILALILMWTQLRLGERQLAFEWYRQIISFGRQ